MPLDTDKGEDVAGLGSEYLVCKTADWCGSPFFEAASDAARDAFQASGCILPPRFKTEDVLVQAYPGANKLLFLFQRRIKGEDHFYPYVFDLEPKTVTQLRLIGMWPTRTIQ